MNVVVTTDNSDFGEIPVRRRNNTKGRATVAISITIPTELHQTINGIVVKSNKSRSLVITELIKKGIENNG